MKEVFKEFLIAFVCSILLVGFLLTVDQLIDFVWESARYIASIIKSL